MITFHIHAAPFGIQTQLRPAAERLRATLTARRSDRSTGTVTQQTKLSLPGCLSRSTPSLEKLVSSRHEWQEQPRKHVLLKVSDPVGRRSHPPRDAQMSSCAAACPVIAPECACTTTELSVGTASLSWAECERCTQLESLNSHVS